MSNRKAVIIVAMLLVVWCGWDMRSDYMWGIENIEYMNRQGWRVAQTRRDSSDIIRFWTLIKPPVSTIIFFDPNNSAKEEDQYVIASTRWFFHEDFWSTAEWRRMMLTECRDRRIGVPSSDPSRLKDGGMDLLSDNDENQELAEFFCKLEGIE
jgi:hypothetical protein